VADQIVLIVRFYVNAASKPVFLEKLKEVFEHIRREQTFVNASLQEDIEHPEQLLVYELWQETRESFLKNQVVSQRLRTRHSQSESCKDATVAKAPGRVEAIAARIGAKRPHPPNLLRVSNLT
jgi:quinol monooxygenase YgiN